MRALVYQGPKQMTIEQWPIPEPKAGEVRVHSRFVGICGSDVHGFLGTTGRRTAPMVMGHEMSGVVSAIGEGVTTVQVGDRVTVQPILNCGVCDYCKDGLINICPDREFLGAMSCNGAFVEMSQSLDPVSWRELCEDFGYNQGFSMDVQYKKSRFSLTEDATAWDLAQASIGQGTTVTTPLLNTMITSAIANNGIMMKPYLVDSFTSDDKTYESVTQPVVLKQCITASEAAFLTQGMEYVVKDGSGYRAGSSFAQVAGKTGSAQYSSEAGRYHAWFTGFAPSDDPQIAVTVLIEGGGSGGEVAAPIAGNIFNYYFALQQSK